MRRMLAGLMLIAALAMSADAAAAGVKRLILRAQGLSIVGAGIKIPLRATFGVSRAEAIKFVASMRGPATKSGTIEDCGSGTPMGYAEFKGGLELSFLDGKFVGWTLSSPTDGTLRTMKDITIGSSRPAFKAAYPTATIEESTLGTEYGSDDAGSGLFDDARPAAKISNMWAGQTCVAR